MATFIGNSNQKMNWTVLVDHLRSIMPRDRGNDQEDDIHIGNPKVEKLIKVWERAGYVKGDSSAMWIDFLPDEHFDNEWVIKFADWLGYEAAGSWVSAVPPGYIVPWHPDYKMPDKEAEWLARGTIDHFTCYICEPKFGQVSIIEGDAIYNAALGDVYKWDNWQDWHGGMNMGLETKYMFNFFGWKK